MMKRVIKRYKRPGKKSCRIGEWEVSRTCVAHVTGNSLGTLIWWEGRGFGGEADGASFWPLREVRDWRFVIVCRLGGETSRRATKLSDVQNCIWTQGRGQDRKEARKGRVFDEEKGLKRRRDCYQLEKAAPFFQAFFPP